MDEAILVIEDEERIARLLEIELESEAYRVGKARNGTEGLEAHRTGKWDLILLDIMLPEISGIEVLRRIRQQDARTPIILLTAKSSVEDKVSGLDLGANDYVTKPFRIEELLARIRAALRLNAAALPVSPSNNTEDGPWMEITGLKLNEQTREVLRNGDSVDLTPREFDLLVFLLKHQRQVLTREQILQAVWGYDYYGDTNVVDVYIRYVRKKIDHGRERGLIHTVRGVGYVLKDPS